MNHTIRLTHVPLTPRGGARIPPLAPPPQPPRRTTLFATAMNPRSAGTSPHPLMAAMYWACADLLGMVSGLGVERSLPTPAELRNVVMQQLATMMHRAQSAGILPEDVVEAQYAIVALIDELLARVHGWSGQAEWRTRPLQLLRFNENTAGENFFRRLAMLETQPHRAHVLQIYFLSMAVGFQGTYAVYGGEGLAPIYERVGARVAQASGADAISPHGEPRESRGILRAEAPLVRLALGFFGIALFVFIVLRVVLAWQVSDATRPMHDYATASGAVGATEKR